MVALELGKAKARPELKLVGADGSGSDLFGKLVARDVRLGRLSELRTLRRGLRYMQIELLYQQALNGRMDLSDLSDDELSELRETINKACENFHTPDSVSFYDAGLLRSQTC
jgi:hypothetical protein